MRDSEFKESNVSSSIVATKLFFARNPKTLATSRSTPSLPDLANNANTSATGISSKKQVVSLSTVMRRGHSHQTTEESTNFMELPKKQIISKRRHSFSSFLNAKYGKASTVDDESRNYKRSITTTPTNINFSNSNISGGGQTHKATQGKKGHRPRSYSEVPFNLPQVERAPPVAITNKTPAYEYYGFVMYLASFVILGIYLIWAYVPDEILHSLGITYYPNRYWALAIPIWLMTVIWFIFFSFISINIMNTEPLYSYHCITDEHANLMRMERETITDRPSDWIPELHDIPIGLVNTFLYQDDLTHSNVVPPKDSATSSILISSPVSNNILFTDNADGMSEEDALALRKRRNSSNSSNHSDVRKRYNKK